VAERAATSLTLAEASFRFLASVPADRRSDYQAGVSPTNGPGILPAANTRVKAYECPADNLYAPLSGGPIDAYWTESGSIWIDYVYDLPGYGHECGRSNYLGCSGYLGPDASPRYTGIYYRSSQTRIGETTDGTSNTIAFGESMCGNGGIGAQRDFALTWMGAGAMPSAWGIPNQTAQNPAGWYQFSSNHTAIVVFAFADGSVRPISKATSYWPFVYASGMQDGQVYNPSDIGQ